MATVANSRDIALQNTSPRLVATSVAISADGASFTKLKNGGAVAPTTITLTAVTTVFTGGVSFAWYYALSTAPTTWYSFGASGSTQSITGSTIPGIIGTGTDTSIIYKVIATQTGYTTASNTFTITYTKEVDEPIVVKISRPSASSSVDALGVPITTPVPNSGTVITAKRGTTDLTYNASSGANTFYISSTSISPSGAVTLGSLTGSGTTATYADITAMSSSITNSTVTYTVTCRDASGTVISPSFTVTQDFTKTTAGSTGSDAYSIRFDNESRILRTSAAGVINSGQLPMTGYTYVTKGGVDITTGFSVAYTVNSTSAMSATVNYSTGVVSITAVSADTGYVEIKADILLPDGTTHFYEYKKLFVYKVKDGALGVNIHVAQDQAHFTYVNGTTTTSTDSFTINFTATLSGITPAPNVTWSAKAFDTSGNEISPGGAALFSFSGNAATMTSTQFGARGNPSTRRVEISASYNTGLQVIKDVAFVYRLDGTGDYGIDTTNNPYFTYQAASDGSVSAAELAKESCVAQVLNLSTLAYVTSGWQFTVTATNATAQINGSTSPYTAGTDPVITLSAITTGTTGGIITITATKTSFPNTVGKIEYGVSQPISDGYSLYFDPKSEIVLPTDPVTGNILSYADAFTYAKVMKGGVDDTANWTFTKVDGPGVTSNLST